MTKSASDYDQNVTVGSVLAFAMKFDDLHALQSILLDAVLPRLLTMVHEPTSCARSLATSPSPPQPCGACTGGAHYGRVTWRADRSGRPCTLCTGTARRSRARIGSKMTSSWSWVSSA